MATLYLTEQRSIVKKDGDTLVVHIPADKERGTEKRTVRVPLIKVDQVVVQGDSTVTTPALLALLEQRADVCFCSYYGQFRGRLAPGFSKNSLLRIEQHRCHDPEDLEPPSVEHIGQHCVSGVRQPDEHTKGAV